MKWWTAFIAPDIGMPFHSQKYSTSSVAPVLSVQSRTFVAEGSLCPTPFSACMLMLLYSSCCAVAQYIDTEDRGC